jgi:hypothetical protein
MNIRRIALGSLAVRRRTTKKNASANGRSGHRSRKDAAAREMDLVGRHVVTDLGLFGVVVRILPEGCLEIAENREKGGRISVVPCCQIRFIYPKGPAGTGHPAEASSQRTGVRPHL